MANDFHGCKVSYYFSIITLLYDFSHPNTFSKYILRKNVNWSTYNQSLVRRGEIL